MNNSEARLFAQTESIPGETQSCEEDDCDFKVYDYVAILMDDGKKLLMSRDLSGQLALPEFSSNSASASFADIYLKDLLRYIDIKASAHVVSHTSFEQYRAVNHFVSVVIIEITTKPPETLHRFVYVSVDEGLSAIAETLEYSEVVRHIKGFVSRPDPSEEVSTPWFSLGYFRNVLPSVDALLSASGHIRVGAPDQVICNESAVLYRIQTNTGNVYFKALPKSSPQLSLTRIMVRFFPDMTLSLICVSEELNAFVSRDFGRPLADLCFTSRFKRPAPGYEDQADIAIRILEQWAKIQQSSVPLTEELVSVGLPLFNASWIRNGYRELLEFLSYCESLPDDLREQADSCNSHVASALSMWDTTPLPNTIVHGDLHERNIAQPGGPHSSFIFFDWDSVFIGHPFLDLSSPDHHELFKQEHAYLRRWANYAELEDTQIIKLSELTKPLQPLVSAIVEMKNSSLSVEDKNNLVEAYVIDFCQAVEKYNTLFNTKQ